MHAEITALTLKRLLTKRNRIPAVDITKAQLSSKALTARKAAKGLALCGQAAIG